MESVVKNLQAYAFMEKHKQLLCCPGLHPDYIIADAKRSNELEPLFFTYENDLGAYYHPLHKSKIPETNHYQLQSAYGYSGPVTTSDHPLFLEKVMQAYKTWCDEQNVVSETIRFHPLIANQTIYRGETYLRRKTVYVDLTVTDLLAAYATRVRTAIRKAIKEKVEVKIISQQEFYQVFPSLYRTRMQEIAAESYYFFNDDYFKHLCQLKNNYRVIAVRQNEILAAAIFLLGGKILEYHLSAANNIGQRLCAMNLLLHHAFLHAKANGYEYAHLGGGVSLSLDDKLLFFKLGFAGKLVDFKMGKYTHNSKVTQF